MKPTSHKAKSNKVGIEAHGSKNSVIKVAKASDPMSVAGAIRKRVSEYSLCEVHVVGKDATMVAIRALQFLTERFRFRNVCTFSTLEFQDDKGGVSTGVRITVTR